MPDLTLNQPNVSRPLVSLYTLNIDAHRCGTQQLIASADGLPAIRLRWAHWQQFHLPGLFLLNTQLFLIIVGGINNQLLVKKMEAMVLNICLIHNTGIIYKGYIFYLRDTSTGLATLIPNVKVTLLSLLSHKGTILLPQTEVHKKKQTNAN